MREKLDENRVEFYDEIGYIDCNPSEWVTSETELLKISEAGSKALVVLAIAILLPLDSSKAAETLGNKGYAVYKDNVEVNLNQDKKLVQKKVKKGKRLGRKEKASKYKGNLSLPVIDVEAAVTNLTKNRENQNSHFGFGLSLQKILTISGGILTLVPALRNISPGVALMLVYALLGAQSKLKQGEIVQKASTLSKVSQHFVTYKNVYLATAAATIFLSGLILVKKTEALSRLKEIIRNRFFIDLEKEEEILKQQRKYQIALQKAVRAERLVERIGNNLRNITQVLNVCLTSLRVQSMSSLERTMASDHIRKRVNAFLEKYGQNELEDGKKVSAALRLPTAEKIDEALKEVRTLDFVREDLEKAYDKILPGIRPKEKK